MDTLAGVSLFIATFSGGGDLTSVFARASAFIADYRRHSAFRTIRGGTFLGLFSRGVDGRQLLSLGYQDRICNRELNAFFFVFNRPNMAFPNFMTDSYHGAASNTIPAFSVKSATHF
jgi:hypothetical protein